MRAAKERRSRSTGLLGAMQRDAGCCCCCGRKERERGAERARTERAAAGGVSNGESGEQYGAAQHASEGAVEAVQRCNRCSFGCRQRSFRRLCFSLGDAKEFVQRERSDEQRHGGGGILNCAMPCRCALAADSILAPLFSSLALSSAAQPCLPLTASRCCRRACCLLRQAMQPSSARGARLQAVLLHGLLRRIYWRLQAQTAACICTDSAGLVSCLCRVQLIQALQLASAPPQR